MDLVNLLDCIQVVDARVQANLVEYGHSGFLRSLLQCLYRRAVVAGCHQVLSVLDDQLGNLGVEHVRDERDDYIMGADFRLKLFWQRYIQADGAGAG